jgi:histidine triad (HIT) family protein
MSGIIEGAERPDEATEPAASGGAFCGLLAGDEVRFVVRREAAVAFAPRGGLLTPGYRLVIRRAHSIGVLDAAPADLQATMLLVQEVGAAMVDRLDAGGVVVLNTSGAASGRSVPHLHFHVVPCWPDDGATFWPADRSTHHIEGSAHDRLTEQLAARSNGTAGARGTGLPGEAS